MPGMMIECDLVVWLNGESVPTQYAGIQFNNTLKLYFNKIGHNMRFF